MGEVTGAAAWQPSFGCTPVYWKLWVHSCCSHIYSLKEKPKSFIGFVAEGCSG